MSWVSVYGGVMVKVGLMDKVKVRVRVRVKVRVKVKLS